MEYGTPPEILPVEMAFNFPLFPDLFTYCVITTKKITTISGSDPNRVKNSFKSTKWSDPNKGQDSSPQSGRTSSRVKTTVHTIDGPNQGHKFKSPQCGQTPPRVKTTFRIMDEPHQGS